MAKLTAQELIDAIKELTVLELNDLVKACEEEFGVEDDAKATARPRPFYRTKDTLCPLTEFQNNASIYHCCVFLPLFIILIIDFLQFQ